LEAGAFAARKTYGFRAEDTDTSRYITRS